MNSSDSITSALLDLVFEYIIDFQENTARLTRHIFNDYLLGVINDIEKYP